MRRRAAEPDASCQHAPPQVINNGSHRDEVQAGTGEEAADEARPVLHPLEANTVCGGTSELPDFDASTFTVTGSLI
jgi:hypothetical protein